MKRWKRILLNVAFWKITALVIWTTILVGISFAIAYHFSINPIYLT